MVTYLSDVPEFQLTIATRTVSKAEAMAQGRANVHCLALDVSDENALSEQVAAHDVVISLLPWTLHLKVAKLCLEHGKHMVTTSYISDAMRELDAPVRAKKLLFLNEIGVDPGIDHMSAMQIIHEVQAKGGKVTAFYSFCGGLPAPDANDNPFGYKFSWSPRGVVLAGRNTATWLETGEVVSTPGPELFAAPKLWPVDGLGEFEVYPNRNSVPYREVYGLQGIKTLMRGTFRNIGWCPTLKRIADLGLLDDTERPELNEMSYAQMTARLVNGNAATVREDTARFLSLAPDDAIIERLAWLGLFDELELKLRTPSYLDALSDIMQQKMTLQAGERDLVLMQHRFDVEYEDGSKERIFATMDEYGIPDGDTAMARTVSLPAAIATRLLLQGKLDQTGVVIPNMPAIYEPVMAELGEMGIALRETRQPL
jgi:saccharopine dehydrogenase-like NADP-dependent oxidoreductase